MKNFIMLLIVILVGFSCDSSQNRHDYSPILAKLSNSYTLFFDYRLMSNRDYLSFFKVTKERHHADSVSYRKGVEEFYQADVEIIDHLLSYRFDTTTVCTWVETTDPFSDFLQLPFPSKSTSALILIDNYLSNNALNIKPVPFATDLTYDSFQSFYQERRSLDKKNLRIAYREHFK